MAEEELPSPPSAASHDASPSTNSATSHASSDSAETEKQRRKIIVLLRIIHHAAGRSVDGLVQSESPETLSELEDLWLDDEDLYGDSDCWEAVTENWKRGCKPCRSTAGQKKPKPALCVRPRPSRERKQRKTRENVRSNAEARKENNEERLKRKHIQRSGLALYFRRTEEIYTGKRGKKQPSKVTAPRSYIAHKPRKKNNQTTAEDHPAALLYELKHNDISDDFSRLLVELQHRDLTPEDYDTLLRLDEKVAPKTVSESALTSFETLTLQSSSNLVGELCSICMEVYSVSERVKTLPCCHTFHCSCIDTWLSTASLNCPLDGIAMQC